MGSKKIYKNNPKVHYGIGSRIDGFILALLSFREVTLIDIRPLSTNISGLNFIQADATKLENISDDSIMSLYALCSLEHFGLGRYGDPIDPEACFKEFNAIQRVCAIGAKIYISVPVAQKDGIQFNAHRIYNPQTIIKVFDKMELKELIVHETHSAKPVKDPIRNKNWGRDTTDEYTGYFEFEKIKL